MTDLGGQIFSLGKKKRDPHSPEPADELRQASGSKVLVADAGPQSSTRNQRTGEKVDKNSACFPDYSAGGSISGGPAAVWGIASTGQTPCKTLELAGRIKGSPHNLLIDLGLTGNYISADVCTVNKIWKEEDPHPDQLTMADGSQVETTGRVQIKIKSRRVYGIGAGKGVSWPAQIHDIGNSVAKESQPSN